MLVHLVSARSPTAPEGSCLINICSSPIQNREQLCPRIIRELRLEGISASLQYKLKVTAPDEVIQGLIFSKFENPKGQGWGSISESI